MTVVSIQNALHYTWGRHCDGWHLATSINLSIIQERVPKGCSEVRHLHRKTEQFFYILSGIATLDIAGEVYSLKPQEGVHVPAGVAHTLSNTHEQELEFLLISTPPAHEDRVNLDSL